MVTGEILPIVGLIYHDAAHVSWGRFGTLLKWRNDCSRTSAAESGDTVTLRLCTIRPEHLLQQRFPEPERLRLRGLWLRPPVRSPGSAPAVRPRGRQPFIDQRTLLVRPTIRRRSTVGDEGLETALVSRSDRVRTAIDDGSAKLELNSNRSSSEFTCGH
jgi:hypothetical protein